MVSSGVQVRLADHSPQGSADGVGQSMEIVVHVCYEGEGEGIRRGGGGESGEERIREEGGK